MLYKFGLTYVIALGILGNPFEHRDKSPVPSVKMLEIYMAISQKDSRRTTASHLPRTIFYKRLTFFFNF